MFLTKIALKRPTSVLLILFSIIVFGITSIFGFKLAYMPGFEMPTFVIITPYIGADPELIDSTVSEEIEAAGSGISGFTDSITVSSEDMSSVILRFEYGTDMDEAYMDIKAKLDNLNLPEDALDPIIMEIAMDNMPMMTLSVSGEDGTNPMSFVNDVLEPEINAIPGVAEVNIRGGREEHIKISPDPIKMQQYGVSIQSISNAVTSYNFEIPIGEIKLNDQELNVSSSSSTDSLLALENVNVVTTKGTMIPLHEVADVKLTQKPADSISRFNGNENISLSITNSSDADVTELSSLIAKEYEELLLDYPEIEIEIISDSSEEIIDSLMSVVSTLILGVLLCMLVLFIFFGNIRASLIVGSSIPLSLVGTLICMSLAGFELNVLTMSALVIAIGMMVDNSIVVLESIFKVKENKLSFFEAAYEGCKAVGASVVASTITTIVVYIPMAILEGMAGQFFSQLGFTIVFAMIASLLSAMILIPLFYMLIKPVEKVSSITRFMDKLEISYEKNARRILKKKKTAMLFSVVLLILSFSLLAFIPIEVMPEIDGGGITIEAELRPNTDLDNIYNEVLIIEEMLASDTTFEQYTLAISDNIATFEAKIGDETPTTEVVDEYLKKTANLVNMTVSVNATSRMAGLGGSDIESTLSGYDYDSVREASLDFTEKIYEIPGVLNVSSSIGSSGSTKVDIEIDPEMAMRHGLSSAQVSMLLRQTITGIEGIETMSIGEDEFEIDLIYPTDTYSDFNSFMNMPISTSTGTIPLSEIATLSFTDNAQVIQRQNGIYSIDLSVTTTSESKDAVEAAIAELENTTFYDNGVEIGSISTFGDIATELTPVVIAILVAIFLVFIVMGAQFESVRFSLMVMTSVLFSFIGAFGLLFILGQELTMVSLMGILMLVGIVVNNGILFVDTANELRKSMPIEDALINSGKMRMRPILMTTLTTILSMVPLAAGFGDEMLQSMGTIIIGGLTTSTLLTLFLMPVMYMLFSKKDKIKNSKNGEEYEI